MICSFSGRGFALALSKSKSRKSNLWAVSTCLSFWNRLCNYCVDFNETVSDLMSMSLMSLSSYLPVLWMAL